MQTITRRDFLRLGAASAAVLAVEHQFGPIAKAAELLEGGRSVNRTSGLPRSFLPSTCRQCPAGCGIIGYVEESRLVKIGGNPKHIANEGTLCARGQAGINALYDPDRLLKPLKRTGARGNGDWTEIEWDEALSTVSQQIAAGRGNPNGFVLLTDDPDRDPVGRRLTHALGSSNVIGSNGVYDGNKRVATQLTWGQPGDMPDVARSKYVIMFGANPLEDNPNFVGLARRIIDGIQQNQTKVVIFDNRITNTSARANELIHVHPGTYGLLALAMANVIMQEGLYNRAFIEQWTNVTPEQLAQHLSQFSPERAEAEAGVSALIIRRVAAEFATTSPATTLSDGNLSNFSNGVQAERAVMLLNIITGNVDNKGGLCLPRQYNLTEPDPAPPVPAPGPLASLSSAEAMKAIRERKVQIGKGVVMTHGFNPVYSNPDGAMNADAFKDETLVPFYVAVTPFINDTAVYADIILPETTYLEDWEIETRPSVEQVPFVSLRQPVVPALESSKSFFDIATELANRAKGGAEQFFAFKSVSDYLKARLGGVDGLVRAGGVDYLKQHGVWYDPKSRPNYGSYQAGGFSTPSGKIEISSQAIADKNQSALPTYVPVASFRDLGEHDLVLVIFQTAIQTDGTGNCMWLNEIQHNNPAMINPGTAGKLGIKDGDKIKITRKNGGETRERSVESEAFLSEGVHPNVIAMAGGVGHTNFGHVAAGEKFKKDEIEFKYLRDANVELIWWGEHGGTGVNPKKIVPVSSDPIGGGQAWGEVVVQVARV